MLLGDHPGRKSGEIGSMDNGETYDGPGSGNKSICNIPTTTPALTVLSGHRGLKRRHQDGVRPPGRGQGELAAASRVTGEV